MKRSFVAVVVIVIVAVLLLVWILSTPEHAEDMHVHEHEEHQDAIAATGPHGGRMLEQVGFAVEIVLVEAELYPEFRVYAYRDNQPLDVRQLQLEIELKRTGGRSDHLIFSPQRDYLRSGIVEEPHSFEVSVSAEHGGNRYTWEYDQFEGRTQIPNDIARAMGVQTETVGPAVLIEATTLTGRVQTNPNRLARVRPRFPGMVNAVHRELGDAVSAGDVLATIQSNESLQDYTVEAPIDGLIIKRDIQLGEASGDQPMFVIADLSEVWVELDVFVRDLDHIRKGMPVTIETLGRRYQTAAKIDWVSPLTAHASQSARARVVVSNEDGRLRPGQFVRGHVTAAEVEVPLAVRLSALQRFRDFQVVFAQFDDVYEVRVLDLGRRSRDWVEVLGGIEAGTRYVTENSYLIKADIEKAGAGHHH
jgi:cobalt-zinc-cadmium efflux system membrane fusion protein